jgi:2-polyprenyl-3-methyl-5-hydroxy-6-metoxy-1,4-benzoquinol methylase
VNIHTFYRPILQHFRKGRMALFADRFAIDQRTKVLDMGGGAFNWTMVRERPQLTILDVYDHPNKAPWAAYVVGNGCATDFETGSFDIVFSNSVIEHVGGIELQRQFAKECMRCGRSFFVQTPNKWFPFDTHTLMLFAHWLPQRMFRKLLRFSPRFLIFKSDAGDLEDFANMRLLSKGDMQELFPGAEIIEEKFCGITKSLIAVSVVPCRDRQMAGVRAQTSLDTESSNK